MVAGKRPNLVLPVDHLGDGSCTTRSDVMSAVRVINAVFRDSNAALVDGTAVAQAEEARFTRHQHGKDRVSFSIREIQVEAEHAREALRALHVRRAPRPLRTAQWSTAA